jgi:mRNA-degrading endonuclease YafQ of YafQ-DinJ toxin-antitoxin module
MNIGMTYTQDLEEIIQRSKAMEKTATQNISNLIKQMSYEFDHLLYGEEYEVRMSRIEECAREIIYMVEKTK